MFCSLDTGAVLSTTPHLITLVDLDTGDPFQTQDLRYGLRVAALVLPAPPILLDADVVDVVGPRAFGYGVDVIG